MGFLRFLVSIVMFVILGPAIIVFLTLGGLTCRAEEEYWSSFWCETPSTEAGFDIVTLEPPCSSRLKKAA